MKAPMPSAAAKAAIAIKMSRMRRSLLLLSFHPYRGGQAAAAALGCEQGALPHTYLSFVSNCLPSQGEMVSRHEMMGIQDASP